MGAFQFDFSFHFRISSANCLSNWFSECNFYRFRLQNGFSRFQWGHLDVVVPPDILDDPESNGASMDEGITNEGGQIQLVCKATGVPQPTVSHSVAQSCIIYDDSKRWENSSNRLYSK